MLTIILKISIIWSLLLVLYFFVLSKEKAAKWNRLYLLFSLCLGIIIPFLESPFVAQQSNVNTPVPSVWQMTVNAGSSFESQTQISPPSQDADWSIILFYVWLIGAVLQLFRLITNAFQLYFLKKYSTLKYHSIADYYTNDNTAAAFSFGKIIFLPNDNYSEKELDLILQHEHNHYKHRHWIDNVLLELMQIVFWAHPLFYFFKKQIKLVHEYEVDADINADDGYEYGRLLLAQNNKTYKTVLVHTFNFSPIKKRIAMMTNTKKANKWKFLLALPLVGLCFTLMSAQPKSDERIREGNITKFRGSTIEWSGEQEQNVEVLDPVSGETSVVTVKTEDNIVKCNNKEVTKLEVADRLDFHAYADPFAKKIANNIYEGLENIKGEFPDAIAQLQVVNLILDKNGKVAYYDVLTIGENATDSTIGGVNKFPEVNKKVDKILSNTKIVNPEKIKSDYDYSLIRVGLAIKTISLNVRMLTPDESKKHKKETEAREVLKKQ